MSGAYAVALENAFTPTFLALSRQNLPNLEGSTPDKVFLGAYTLFGMYVLPTCVDMYVVYFSTQREKRRSCYVAFSPFFFFSR